jgi:HSP20 family molecular chaperone IbpA
LANACSGGLAALFGLSAAFCLKQAISLEKCAQIAKLGGQAAICRKFKGMALPYCRFFMEGYRPMSRQSYFNSPLLLGFDQIERVLDKVAKHPQEGYPPYNIEQFEDGALRITLAVAGFSKDDLAVTVEDNQLVIRGKQTDDEDRAYLYRGIAARQFQRSFVLADGIEVSGADLENGLLHVDLDRPQPAVEVKTIEINASDDETPQAMRKIELLADKSK